MSNFLTALGVFRQSGPIRTRLDSTNGAQERHHKRVVSHWQGAGFSAGLCRRPKGCPKRAQKGS